MTTKQTKGNGDRAAESLDSIEYDPLMPGLTVLHRAGIAGLALQIESMKERKGGMSPKDARGYSIPKYEPTHDGRGIRIMFTRESFYSLMRERYRGILVHRVVGQENHKLRQKPKAKTKRYVFVKEVERGKFEYLDPRPLLRNFEVFKAHEAWQEHTRDAIWNSYYCIPNNRLIYKLPGEPEKNDKIDKLWKALCKRSEVGLDKPIFPTSFAKSLKDTEIKERAENALLLHFWPLVSGHFIPVNLKADKDEKTREIVLRHEWQSPVVVVPDVADVETFVGDFKDFLGALGTEPSECLYENSRKITTPLEASLAFFAAPRLARSVRAKVGTRGAEVYVFKKRKGDRQPLVSAIVNESLDPEIVDEYRRLMEKRIFSLPFRAVCVQNLLAKPRRTLYEGFDLLVEWYPLELFVATKRGGQKERRFLSPGGQMARSLREEFKFIEQKERKRMNDEEQSIQFMMWRITQNYIRWRACTKAQPTIEAGQIKSLFARLRTAREKKQQLSREDEALRWRYNAAVGDVVEKLFIEIRGNREAADFANAFSETLFRAPQNITPKQAKTLRSFYEGADWESGRRLVLMAISAAGANASSASAEVANGNSDGPGASKTGGNDD